MTPRQLAARMIEIVAQECKCEVVWLEHAGPVTIAELARIVARTSKLILDASEEAGDLCSICLRPVIDGKWHEHAAE